MPVQNPHRDNEGEQDLPIATYLCCEGSCTGYDAVLQAVPIDQAVLAEGYATTRWKGEQTVNCRPQEARRSVRMYPLRLLLDVVPIVLVEQ